MESQNLLAVSFSSGTTLLYLPLLKKAYRNFGRFSEEAKIGGVATIRLVTTKGSNIH